MSTVFVQLACAFRYGSDDLDVMGLCFRKDIWIQHVQIYPESHKPTLNAMHETLLMKAGDNTYPFSFEVCPDPILRLTRFYEMIQGHNISMEYYFYFIISYYL